MIISLDYGSDIPIYLQIRNEIVKGIGTGGLKFGEQLPTVRSLAADTGVNAMTVNKAYALLKSQGYITADRRRGACVCARDAMPSIKGTGRMEQELLLLTSEAAIGGLSRDEFIKICESCYPDLTVPKPT